MTNIEDNPTWVKLQIELPPVEKIYEKKLTLILCGYSIFHITHLKLRDYLFILMLILRFSRKKCLENPKFGR